MCDYLDEIKCDNLVEICYLSGGNQLAQRLILDRLIEVTTLASSSVKLSLELVHICNSVSIVTTTSEGDEHVTVVGGADCFDCGRSKSVDHDKKKRFDVDVF